MDEEKNMQTEEGTEAAKEKAAEDSVEKQTEGKKDPQADREKKYTDADVDAIINKKFAKMQQQFEEKQAEAEKLAKMNADQKKDYELQKAQEELAELKSKQARMEMTDEARKMLREAEISDCPDELLSSLVQEDAEATKAAIQSLIDYTAGIVKKSARQEMPKGGGTVVEQGSSQQNLADFARKNRIIKE